jgi:CheY-like chemotaxis protein
MIAREYVAEQGESTMKPAKDRAKILVVYKDTSDLLMVSSQLRDYNVEALYARSVALAEEALLRWSFELVIIDHAMTGVMNVGGMELAKYVKRYWPATKIVFLLAHQNEEVRQGALDVGVEHILVKTSEVQKIGATVLDVVRGQKPHRNFGFSCAAEMG